MNTDVSWFAGSLQDQLEKKVDAGIAYLDSTLPVGWDRKIDLEKLDVESSYSCPLVQATGMSAWRSAIRQLGLTQEQISDYGFRAPSDFTQSTILRVKGENERLTAIWRCKLGERREPRFLKAA